MRLPDNTLPVIARHAALATYKAASDLIGKAAFFAILIVAARALSIESFGLFSLASTLGWILAVATDFGLTLHAAREIARAPGSVTSILGPILRLRLWLAGTGAALTVIAAGILLPPREALAFTAIVLAYLVNALVELLNYVYRAVARSDLESTLNLIQRLATLALALVLLRIAPGLGTLAAALLAPAIVMLLVSLRLVSHLGAAQPIPSAPFVLSRATFMRDVFPLGLGIALSALYFRIDLFLVEYWRGIGEVAIYNAVFRLVEALRLFPSAILAVLLPIVFGRPTGGFVLRMSAGLALLGVAVTAVLYPLVPQIIELTYGPDFLGGIAPFRVLLLAFPFLALNYGLTHAVIGWRGQRAFAVGCAGALAANIGLNAMLIPDWGATGAAWATLVTEVLLTVAWSTVLARRRPSPGVRSPAS
jgi:O-antigen/teichoic acid export membrane protein